MTSDRPDDQSKQEHDSGPTLPLDVPTTPLGHAADSADSRPAAVGPYRILDTLGDGGMGVVYLAEQREPVRRRVAIKLIKLGMDTREVVARFESERNALALMDHPNIARVYDAGISEDGRPYFAMELVRGVPIDRFCDDEKLSIPERLDLFRQVCNGIHHAHHRGVVHRDIKPSNILVAPGDDSPTVKVIDFGVAKAMNQRLTERTLYTELGRAVGTPTYMSPEQAGLSSEDVDHRTDVYSLGVLLYEILIGELPHDWASPSPVAYDEIVRRIREEDPPTPSSRWTRLSVERSEILASRRRSSGQAVVRAVRGDLDWIAMRAMEKEPERRYSTVSELESDIGRHLRNEPVVASPPGFGYRAHKFVRRHRAMAAASVAVALALFIGAVIAAIATIRMHRAHRDAQVGLADLYTRSGMEAAERGDASQALLWFASALEIPHGDEARYEAGRIRFDDRLREAALPVRVFDHGEATLTRIRVHPASTYLLTLDSDSRCAVWDIASGKRLEFNTRDRRVSDAAWSPKGDSLVLASEAGSAEILALPGGIAVDRVQPSLGALHALAFSRDGRLLALAGDGVRIWDCAARQLIGETLEHGAEVRWVGFNARGDRLLTSALDQRARVFGWGGSTFGRRPLFEALPHFVRFNIPGLPSSDLEWRPTFVDEGAGVLTVRTPTELAWWDSETGERVRTLPATERLRAALPSPNGEIVAIVDLLRVRFWNVARNRFEEASLEPGESWNEIREASWSPDGASMLVLEAGGKVALWERVSRLTSGGTQFFWRLRFHTPSLSGEKILHSRDAGFFATVKEDSVRLWRIPAANLARCRRRPLPLIQGDEVLSSDGQFGMLGRNRLYKPVRSVEVFELEHSTRVLSKRPLAGKLIFASFSPDNEWVQVSSESTAQGQIVVEFWNWRSGERTHVVDLPAKPRGSAWTEDSEKLVLRLKNGDIVTVDRRSGTILSKVNASQEKRVFIAPGARDFVSWTSDGPARVRDTATGEARSPGLAEDISCRWVDFSPDGRRALTTAHDYSVRVWDLDSGRALSKSFTHPARLRHAEIRGERFLTVCADGFVRIRDWRKGSLIGRPVRLTNSRSTLVQFDPSTRWLVTFDREKGLRVLDWETGIPVVSFREMPVPRLSSLQVAGERIFTATYHVELQALLEGRTATLDGAALELAELLSGQTIRFGNPVPLTDSEWEGRRQRILDLNPATLSLDVSPEGRVAWHRQRAAVLESTYQLEGALWHLRKLRGAMTPAEQERFAELRSWVRSWRFSPDASVWAGAEERRLADLGASELATITQSALGARRSTSFGPFNNFRNVYPDRVSLSIGYCVRVVRSSADRDVDLLAGADDTLRVWLNGTEIAAYSELGPAIVDTRRVRLKFRAGENILLVEVGQSGGGWGFYARFESTEGELLHLNDAGELQPARLLRAVGDRL